MSEMNKINYSLSGPENGRRWVFVHGLMGFLNNWKKITSNLDATERSLCYDQRGHGRSFKPDSGYAPEDYARDLKDLTDQLGWDRFILVGHSMGGRNVLVFASMFPEKVEKLIVEDIGPEANENSHVYYEKLLGCVPTPFETREQARDFFHHEFPKVAQTKEASNVIGAFLYANLEDKGGRWDWRFSKSGVLESVHAGRFKDRWQEVKNLKVPTLWIRGGNSKELSRENFEKVLSMNQMIQGVEIPGAGHWIHSEKSQEFTQVIKNFVGGF